jgi:hypothetical protein
MQIFQLHFICAMLLDKLALGGFWAGCDDLVYRESICMSVADEQPKETSPEASCR